MEQLTVDERGIGTEARRISWAELVAVGIRTTADGPFSEDVFWLLLLRDGVVELPGSLVSSAHLAEMQDRLPGLDSGKIIQAMGSAEERIFRVWHAEESRSGWTDEALRARFVALVERLGGNPTGASDACGRLRTAWGADGRRYHDLEHLTDCLRELDAAPVEPGPRDLAELALWFHDAVYEPSRTDDEERSAQLLIAEAATLGIPAPTAEAAAELVRRTAHGDDKVSGSDALADLVSDVDLSILGRDVLRFMEYEHGVSEEYAAVPALAFQLGRGRFLAALLSAPAIFRTAWFRDRYEARARERLARLLKSPRYRTYRWLRWLPLARRLWA